MDLHIAYYRSPAGLLEIEGTYDYVDAIRFVDDDDGFDTQEHLNTGAMAQCIKQLDGYFNRGLKTFHFPMRWNGTAFQQRVWDELTRIPFGQTINYLELARRLGDEKSIRAAASANGKNPLAIAVPCHRVIGSDGSLTGYAGGPLRKQWLLDHEARVSGHFSRLF